MIKITKRIFIIGFGLIFSSLVAQAEIKWTKQEGWHLEDGVLKTVLGQVDKAPQSGVAMYQKAIEAERKGDYSTAISLYKQIYTDYSSSVLAPQALYGAGIIRGHYHQFAEADKLFTKIMKEYPQYDHYDEVVQAEFNIASRMMAGERPYYWGIIPGFRDYSNAQKYFETVVKYAPYSPLAPEALMNSAVLAQKDDETDKAIDALERLIYGYSNNELAPDAYLMLAGIHKGQVFGPTYDQGETRDALGYYQDFVTLYPSDPKVTAAREGVSETKETLAESEYLIGEFYYVKRNNAKAAKIFYNRAIDLAPHTDAAKSSRERLARIQDGTPAPKQFIDYLLGRHEEEPERDFMAEAEDKS